MRKPDEIMAEYLLKGGKMLSKTCPSCGSPLFTYKGKTFCVVCAEKEHEKKAESIPHEVPVSVDVQSSSSGRLADEMEETLTVLLRKIRTEPDACRVNELMQAVRLGAEAYLSLSKI